MLITFEGIDGSGKSTQIRLLEQELKNQGFLVGTFREPGGTQLSEKIRNLLLTQDLEINPIAETFLFSAARVQLITEKVKPLLERNAAVILDRYYDSTIAYQGYGRSAISLPDLHKLNMLAACHLEPDITFYLKLSLKQAEGRTLGGVKDRMEKSGKAFYSRVIRGFDRLARKEKRVVVIDASKQPGEIHQAIMDQLYNKFSGLKSP